VIGTAFKYVLM